MASPSILGFVALISVGRGSAMARFASSSDTADTAQLVHEAHLVFDVRLTGKAMSSSDHAHHFEPFDGSGGRLHRLKAPRWSKNPLGAPWSASMLHTRHHKREDLRGSRELTAFAVNRPSIHFLPCS
jgi:hypothetical protein